MGRGINFLTCALTLKFLFSLVFFFKFYLKLSKGRGEAVSLVAQSHAVVLGAAGAG